MHGEPTKWAKNESSIIKELLGKWLFVFYAVFYAAFIIINVVNPKFMGIDIGGLNIAIGYGFGLILLAMLFAFAYNHISTKTEQLFHQKEDEVCAEPDEEEQE